MDQVIASVPINAFGQANEAQFYVTMSGAGMARATSKESGRARDMSGTRRLLAPP